jgi:ribosomal protein S12 methylthiotransferase accessory factor
LAPSRPSSRRGRKRRILLRSRRVRYTENGARAVPLERTLAEVERFFLAGGMEAQFCLLGRRADRAGRAFLKYLSPAGKANDRLSFGKGLNAGQALASACFEFFERHCAAMRPDDIVREAPYKEVAGTAVDPRRFVLAGRTSYDPALEIDWAWGYTLTRAKPVLVPANLVFCPYEARRREKHIAWMDSNGLASGNNLEEAVLHGLLEVVERDAVAISEYNRLPPIGLDPASLPAACRPTLELLEGAGFRASFFAGRTDLPIPFVAAFLQHRKRSSDCSVAFGCDLDPVVAAERALTEAIQLLPPAHNHRGWLRSGSPRRYAAKPSAWMRFDKLKSLATADLRDNIRVCVAILKSVGADVIVVDLGLPEIPFPAVRVLVPGLQPVLHRSDMRLSRRFFEVPVKLGLRTRPRDPAGVKIWPLCGYK